MLALVTGAGVRVGKAIALALAGDGCDVVLHAHTSLNGVRDTAAHIEALGRRAFLETADLSDDDAVDALAARIIAAHGTLDVVVHNAAIFEELSFKDIDRARFRRMQRINVEAPFFLTQGLLPALAKSEAPVIVHIVDVTADRPMNHYAHYTTSKAALAGLTKALTIELAPKVRVCGVAPGIVAFPKDFSPEQRAHILQRIPLRREGSPDDVGRAVAFLVRSPYMNGVLLPVDGGWQVTL